MIRSLRGTVLSVLSAGGAVSVVLDVNGLGFDVLCSRGAGTLCEAGREARLTVHMQVSEAGAFLFGFADETERQLFLKMTAIKGIGGRTAMAILGAMAASEVALAASTADVGAFARVPGVGRKTAERLCLELKDGVAGIEKSAGQDLRAARSAAGTVEEALVSLGFSRSAAASALSVVRAALADGMDEMTEEALLKAALKELHGA
ncbi:MAG: Holliday junction branch migration protein RuvA [Synergistaceae bacterium]|jgi:Holliday junction DNA helicase RuvA|nr:Holliday junction branch migration protein RuvA [Synergistaceae bacterium]